MHSKLETKNCNGTPTDDWQRQQKVAAIKKHNAKIEQGSKHSLWITEFDNQYMITEGALPESNQERVNVFDKDYTCDSRDRPVFFDQSALTFNEQSFAPTMDQSVKTHKEHLTSQISKEQKNSFITTKVPIFPDDFPVSLNSIKKDITEKDGDACIPLDSALLVKERRRMLYFPLEFGEITM